MNRRRYGPARRGEKPPVFPVTAIDDPAPPEALGELAAARTDERGADTVTPETVHRAQDDRLVAAPGSDHRSDDRHRAAAGAGGPAADGCEVADAGATRLRPADDVTAESHTGSRVYARPAGHPFCLRSA
ncbi:hypothetical protein ACIGW1_37240 [Streptomyces sp. NPDC053780]|uniref:hypothetical protein n=1 Tax=unclassified Streptomyces TaxID=2593676 RepID=UPI003429082D